MTPFNFSCSGAIQACSTAADCIAPGSICVEGFCALATCATNADCPAGTGCLADYCCDGRNVCVAFCPSGAGPVRTTPRRTLPSRPKR